MDIDFTPEQDLLRDSVRRSCERYCGLDEVRTLENDPVGYSTALWTQLAELGVVGVTIPEEHGGSGMSMLDAVVIYEEFGRSLVPSPHFASAILAAGLLSRSANTELAARLLPQIASGQTIVTVASMEPDASFGPSGVTASAVPDGHGFVVSGVKVHVPYAQAATSMVVIARVGEGRDADGLVAVLVDTSAPGVTLEQQLTVASDAQFRVTLDGVRVDDGNVVHDGSHGWAAWHSTMLDGITLLAAQAAGGARATLDLAVAYANTREQFDKPLAAFQAISHYLSDAATAVDGAQTLAWEAAWANDHPADDAAHSSERLAPMAKAFACRTFRDVTATAVQIFGGNGFTVDFDVQLYFRRAKSLQLNNWNDRYLDDLIAAQVLDS